MAGCYFDPVDTTNPLVQLVTILEKVQSIDIARTPTITNTVGGALLFVTDPEREGEIGLTDRATAYLRLLELAKAGQEFIDETLSARAKERTTLILQRILVRLTGVGPATQTQALQHPNLPAQELDQLRTVADTMSMYDNIRVIPAEEVTTILGMISELEEFIRACSLPNAAKRRLMKSLAALRLDMQLMEFVDTRRLEVDVDAIIGSGVWALAGSKTDEEKAASRDYIERASRLADAVSKWTDTGTKLLPLGTTILKALGIG